MIKTELTEKIFENIHGYDKPTEKEIVHEILEKMVCTLADGKRIEVRDFGAFHIEDRKARTGRNPKTGEAVELKKRKKIKFKPGLELRQRVNVAAGHDPSGLWLTNKGK